MRRRIHVCVAAALLVVAAGQPAHSQAPVQRACDAAAGLWRARLLDEAQRAYAGIRRAAPDERCATRLKHPPDRSLEILQSTRAALFERARTIRRTAALRRRGVPRHRLRAWWREAYDSYLGGLSLDPSSAGARRGLRALLVASRPRGPRASGRNCERARELLSARLLTEARGELVRANAGGGPALCDDVRRALVDRRRKAYAAYAAGRSSERSGDAPGARIRYAEALRHDPGFAQARSGLARTSPIAIPRPAETSWKWPGFLSSVPNAFPTVVFWGLVVLAVVLGCRVGWRRWLAGRLPRTRKPPDVLELRREGPVDALQLEALELAAQKLRQQPAVAAAGAAAPLILQTIYPTEGADADAPGGDDFGFGPVTKVRGLFRFADRYDGRQRSTGPLAARPGDGFAIGRIVDSKGVLARDAIPDLDVPAGTPRTAEALSQAIVSRLRQEDGP